VQFLIAVSPDIVLADEQRVHSNEDRVFCRTDVASSKLAVRDRQIVPSEAVSLPYPGQEYCCRSFGPATSGQIVGKEPLPDVHGISARET
jgi:hypothetical protein